MKTDLNELISHHIIDEETAQRIRRYYAEKSHTASTSRFLLILSLTGIVLVGLGIILILAYNWDILSKGIKITVAFLPLLIAQGLGFYTLRKKVNQPLWTESAALAILFTLGIGISLLSQIYHIEADLSGFLKWWIILSLALLFIFESNSVSLAIWIGIGWYLTTLSWDQNNPYDFFPFVIIAMLAAWYGYQLRSERHKNLLVIHHWVIPVILTIFLFFHGPLICNRFMIVGCVVLLIGFGVLAFTRFEGQKVLSNGYRIAQFLGIWIVGMMMTFDFFWTENTPNRLTTCLSMQNVLPPFIFLLLLIASIFLYFKKKVSTAPDNMWWMGFSLIGIIFIGDINSGLGQFMSNLLVLVAAGKLIYEGVTRESLIIVNLGLLALTVWILVWFFSHDFSFIWKGLVFIALGLLCFGINVLILKKQKT